ncbi:MAG TPA: hypothetical protein VIL71_06400 [Spirillospora sp.]
MAAGRHGRRRTAVLGSRTIRRPDAPGPLAKAVAITSDARHVLSASGGAVSAWWDLAEGRCVHQVTPMSPLRRRPRTPTT